MSNLKTKKQTNKERNEDKYINTFVRGPKKPKLKKRGGSPVKKETGIGIDKK